MCFCSVVERTGVLVEKYFGKKTGFRFGREEWHAFSETLLTMCFFGTFFCLEGALLGAFNEVLFGNAFN